MKGRIILIPVPYTDLTAAKLRPALVIFEGRRDLIVAAITSKMLNTLPEWDVLIGAEDPEFYKTGLKVASVLKLTKIATVRKDLAEGELGTIDGDLRDEVNQKMKRIFEI
jgi:mRNA interferase MazF